MKRYIRPSLIMNLLLAAGLVQAQNINSDVEVNHPIPYAKPIDVSSGSAVVNGTLGKDAGGDDSDFFSFQAKAGDVVTIDIDGAANANCLMSLDTSLGLYQSAIVNGQQFPLLTSNVDSDAPDEGSVMDCNGYYSDPYIAPFRIPADGTYIVAVAAGWASFGPGGAIFDGDPYASGSYTLIISGVTPAVTSSSSSSSTTSTSTSTTTVDPVASTTTSTAPSTTTTTSTAPSTATTTSTAPSTATTTLIDYISIDIKPGQAFTKMSPNASGKFPVALLSSATFNALNVDTATLTFGATGRETALVQCTSRDVNRDGLLDLVCHADNQKAGFKATTVDAAVNGKTKAGRSFTGHGTLKVAHSGGKKKAR